jgi:hypothetical protein
MLCELIDAKAYQAVSDERATYALEAVKMRLNNTKNNAFKVLAFGVQ